MLATLGSLLVVLMLALGLAACGGGEAPTANAPASTRKAEIIYRPKYKGQTIVVGALANAQERLLGEIYGQALEADGFRVKRDFSFPSEAAARQALMSGRISGFPAFDSSALVSLFGYAPSDLPVNPNTATFRVREELLKEGMISFQAATHFQSQPAVAVLQTTAERDHLTNLSDLRGKTVSMELAVGSGCQRQPECLGALEKTYEFKFRAVEAIAPESRFAVLDDGRADLSVVSSTDPQLSAEGDKYVVLRDDEHALPPGNVVWVTKEGLATRWFPDYRKWIELVQEGLTQEKVRELNAKVMLDGEAPAEVAAAYLKSAGYTS